MPKRCEHRENPVALDSEPKLTAGPEPGAAGTQGNDMSDQRTSDGDAVGVDATDARPELHGPDRRRFPFEP